TAALLAEKPAERPLFVAEGPQRRAPLGGKQLDVLVRGEELRRVGDERDPSHAELAKLAEPAFEVVLVHAVDGVGLLPHEQQPVALVRLRRLDDGAGDRPVVLYGLAPADDDLEVAGPRLDGDLHEAFGEYPALSGSTTPVGAYRVDMSLEELLAGRTGRRHGGRG